MHAYRNHLPLSRFFLLYQIYRNYFICCYEYETMFNKIIDFFSPYVPIVTFSELTIYTKLHNTHIFFSIQKHVTLFNDSYWKLSTNIQENEFFHFIGDENNIKTGDWKRFSRHNFRTSARNTNVLCSDDDRHRLNYYLIFKQNTFVIVIHFFLFCQRYIF